MEKPASYTVKWEKQNTKYYVPYAIFVIKGENKNECIYICLKMHFNL